MSVPATILTLKSFELAFQGGVSEFLNVELVIIRFELQNACVLLVCLCHGPSEASEACASLSVIVSCCHLLSRDCIHIL
ncbi:hypothetical protein DY000_02040436 [Brassica cretica]|uniref:Uncharacterized protein n=1 Tax=Brassica cretica TaxID=69181 RepID=A0ABQ7BJH0_BRACR|nr:hypothetical protein DY000_02040436 [Brassica cretica]